MENFKIALKLSLICFISVLLLSIVNLITYKKILENSTKIEEKTNRDFFSGNVKFEKKFFKEITIDKNKEYYYIVFDKSDNIVGYIVSILSKGYGGDMRLIVATDPSFKIINVKLLNNSETPGIGKIAEKKEYMKKFIGTNTENNPIPLTKNMLPKDDADSVSGATITFKGVANGIKKAVDYLNNYIR